MRLFEFEENGKLWLNVRNNEVIKTEPALPYHQKKNWDSAYNHHTFDVELFPSKYNLSIPETEPTKVYNHDVIKHMGSHGWVRIDLIKSHKMVAVEGITPKDVWCASSWIMEMYGPLSELNGRIWNNDGTVTDFRITDPDEIEEYVFKRKLPRTVKPWTIDQKNL